MMTTHLSKNLTFKFEESLFKRPPPDLLVDNELNSEEDFYED